MRGVDLIAAFELEIDKIDNALQKPITDDSLYWINQAVVKFVKDRFNGNAPKRTSYEQNEKRTRDLIKLYRESKYIDDPELMCPCNIDPNLGINATITKDVSHPSYDSYEYTYPENMMFVLNEDVVISSPEDKYMMDTCVFECTADNFMYRINNKLTDFHYRFHRARPLRVRTKDGFRLLTDKKYKIKKYTLGYIKVPTEITAVNPFENYTDFTDNTWLEIIKIAAQMYVENKGEQRYRTLTNEVLTQE